MARIDRIREEIGRLKLHFGLLVAGLISFLVWGIQDTSAYLDLIKRLIEAYSWSNRLLLFFVIAPVLFLTVMVGFIDWAIRRKIRELEDCGHEPGDG